MMILIRWAHKKEKTGRGPGPAEALIGDSSTGYIATSQILDDEMAARIEHHRQG